MCTFAWFWACMGRSVRCKAVHACGIAVRSMVGEGRMAAWLRGDGVVERMAVGRHDEPGDDGDGRVRILTGLLGAVDGCGAGWREHCACVSLSRVRLVRQRRGGR